VPEVHLFYVIDSVDRPGGAEQALAAMAPGLIQRGVALDVAYLLDRPGFQPELTDAGATLFPVTGLSRAATTRELTRLLRQRRPDLVHTTLYEADLTGRLAARAAGVPVVSSLVNASYGPEHLGSPGLRPWKVRLAQGADAATARLCRRFHAISGHVAEAMTKRLRLPRDRVDVVPRGRDPQLLGTRAPARRTAVRQQLGLAAETPTLLVAARHEYQKGIDVLVEAMPLVRRAVPDVVLLVAGRFGTESDRIQDLMARHDVSDRVRLLGARTDVADLQAAVDVYVAPSRWEGLGSAVVEAMGIGTPVVASDVPALREGLGSEAAGWLVPSGDPAALAPALVQALTDPGEAQSRAAAAHQRFCERYTIERVLDGMLAFYARALLPDTLRAAPE
jgi:glycosyltransferase involved in cell wall biosynthesis